MALPGYSIAAPDVPEAVDLNPSAIAFLPSWSLGYVHTDAAKRDTLIRGDGFYAATPLIYGFALGVSIDSVRPTIFTRQSQRTMGSIALAWGFDQAFSVGGAVRFLGSGDRHLDGLTTLDLAASWRPVDWLATSFIARDVVGPGLRAPFQSVPRSFLFAAALRPTGDRWLTLDVAGIVDENGHVGGRASAQVGVPYVGRALAAVQGERLDGPNPDVRVTAGLAIDWGMIGAGGGVIAGDGLSHSPGWYVSAHVQGAERPGLPRGSYVLEVPLESTGARGILQTVRRLDRALYDPRVAGVLLHPRGSGMGLAYAQELRIMIDALKASGKRVVCYLDDATGSEWYACAGADRILLDPAGGVRLTGPASEMFFLGDLLQRVGIRADFVRIGRYKSAIEEFMNEGPTPPARRQDEAVLDWAYRRITVDAARDLGVSPERIGEIIDQGPQLPPQAVELGMVHALADEHAMDAELREGFGGSFGRETGEPWEVPERWGHRPRIGVVVVDGTIVDGDNVDIPLIGIHMSGGRTVVRAIDRLAADPSVVAIVLRIDSGGGSVLASDQIYRAILRARRHKPVIASMGAIAASGGYYIASAAQEIWADPTTITGSIGVWFGKVDFAPLGRMIGVNLETMGRGAHAGATSYYRPFTPDERAVLANSVRHWYRMFLRRVARGRGMSVQEVDALGRGRLWMGDQAIDNGLIDHLGGFGPALAAARRAAGVGPEVDIEIEPSRPSSLLDYVLGALGIGATPVDPAQAEAQGGLLARVAPELRAVLSAVITLRQLGAAAPMAMLPETIVVR